MRGSACAASRAGIRRWVRGDDSRRPRRNGGILQNRHRMIHAPAAGFAYHDSGGGDAAPCHGKTQSASLPAMNDSTNALRVPVSMAARSCRMSPAK